MLEILVGTTGTTERVTVVKSSGVPVLDESAVKAVRRWRFRPAETSSGTKVPQTIRVPIDFQLR